PLAKARDRRLSRLLALALPGRPNGPRRHGTRALPADEAPSGDRHLQRGRMRPPAPAAGPRPALVRLLLEAGLRKGEARHLQLRHVDVEQSRLVILEGRAARIAYVPIASDLVVQLLGLAIREGLGPDDHLRYATKMNQSRIAHIHRERPIGEAT